MSICALPLFGGGSFIRSLGSRYPVKLNLSEASVRTAAERLSARGAPSRDIGNIRGINQGFGLASFQCGVGSHPDVLSRNGKAGRSAGAKSQ